LVVGEYVVVQLVKIILQRESPYERLLTDAIHGDKLRSRRLKGEEFLLSVAIDGPFAWDWRRWGGRIFHPVEQGASHPS